MTSPPPPSSSPQRRLYGRASGRPLSARRRALVGDLGPRVALPAGDGPIDPAALFPGARAARLELGFGGGEHLVGQALAHPDVGVIGVEPFEEGYAKALALIAETDLGPDRIRVERGDGRPVVDRIASETIETVYVLFPDPWPKTRHRKRRLIQPDTVAAFARVLKPGGRLRVATDVKRYIAWTLEHVRAHEAFRWTARGPSDWRTPPADHITTRYEAKNIGDCPPTFLDFERL